MAKAVFTHADGSRYDDLPGRRYHFPRTYLNAAEQAVGDLIVYYESRRADGGNAGGRQAYFAVAQLDRIVADRHLPDHFYGEVSGYLSFPNPVPFREGGIYYESILQKDDGSTSKGAFGRSVRIVPDAEFDAITDAGFAGVRESLGPDDWAPVNPQPERHDIDEAPAPFIRPILERLTRRPFREAAFARQVKTAYALTCAVTGLRILNGGGRPEVQAAHILPVEKNGPDTVRNGIALSGTIHWMFDRGLISVAEDHSILVAEQHVPDAVQRMIMPDRKLILPKESWLHPHPAFLAAHREGFKG